MSLSTNYVKEIYENENMINFYNDLTNDVGLLQIEKKFFLKYFNKKYKILDIGCGTGRTTIGLKKLGFDNVIGVDISEEMIKKAKENNEDINFEVEDATELSYSDNKFDGVIFSFNGIMLIPGLDNRKKAFEEIYRVLKPGGLFIFSTPFLDNKLETDFWKEKRNKSKLDPSDPKFGDIFLDDFGVEDIYIHLPMVSEVKRCLQKSEFEIIMNKRRLNVMSEEPNVEKILDDNMYWIVKKEV